MLRKNFLLTAFSLLVALAGGEVLLRVAERNPALAGKFNLLTAATYEHFFFFSGFNAVRQSYSHAAYDPLLGWRNTGRPVINSRQNKDTLTSDGWRGVHEFTKQKNKKRRVILIGASFTYGFMVDDSETMAAYLERELGDDTEVYSMAVPAWSVDQMTLAATRIAPDYNPDVIIVAFSADDLKGSCSTFSQGLRKPYFTLRGDTPELHGVPVETPARVMADHDRFFTHLWDGVVVTATRSRVVRLAGQIALQKKHHDCIENLNAALFRSIYQDNKGGARLILAHLDGDLPPALDLQLRKLPVEYVSLPAIVDKLSRSTGIPKTRFKDRHPRPPLLHLYGLALAQAVSSQSGAAAAKQTHSLSE